MKCAQAPQDKNFRLAYSGPDDFLVVYNSYQNAKLPERSNFWGWSCTIYRWLLHSWIWGRMRNQSKRVSPTPNTACKYWTHFTEQLMKLPKYHVSRKKKKRIKQPRLSWVKGEIFQEMLSYPWPPWFHGTASIQQEKELSFSLSFCVYWSKTYTVGWQGSVEKCSWPSGGEGFSLGELAYHSSQRPWKLAVA